MPFYEGRTYTNSGGSMNILHQTELIRSGGYWTIPKLYLRYFKDPVAVLVLSEIFEQSYISGSPEFVSFSYQNIANRLFISIHAVSNVVKSLIDKGILSTKRIGIPSKIHYKIHMDIFNSLIEKHLAESNEKSENATDCGSEVRTDCETDRVIKETIISKETEDDIKPSSSDTADAVPSGVGNKDEMVSKPPLLKRRQFSPMFPSYDVERIFKHWNNLSDPLPKHRIDANNKTFVNAVAAIQKAMKRYNADDIIMAMDNYSRLINDPLSVFYWPTQRNRPGLIVGLSEFFRFAEFTEERMLKVNDLQMPQTWFSTCVREYNYILNDYGKYERDDNPKVTEALKTYFKDKFNYQVNYSVSDVNCFIRAAKFVIEYHNSNKDKINWNSALQEKQSAVMFSRRLIDCLADNQSPEYMVMPNWLCSFKTQSSRFPGYLRKLGMLDAPVTKPKQIKKGYDPGYSKGEID